MTQCRYCYKEGVDEPENDAHKECEFERGLREYNHMCVKCGKEPAWRGHGFNCVVCTDDTPYSGYPGCMS